MNENMTTFATTTMLSTFKQLGRNKLHPGHLAAPEMGQFPKT
jgi:hypothetical protein